MIIGHSVPSQNPIKISKAIQEASITERLSSIEIQEYGAKMYLLTPLCPDEVGRTQFNLAKRGDKNHLNAAFQ